MAFARLLGREPSNDARATRKGYVLLTCKVHEEGKYFVSRCEELGTSSFGETLDEAFRALKDATRVYLETLVAEGEIHRVLQERGVQVFDEPFEDDLPTDVPLRLGEYGRRVQVPVPTGC